MYQEQISVMVWATEHPYLYTMIKLNLPLALLFGSLLAKVLLFGFKTTNKRN